MNVSHWLERMSSRPLVLAVGFFDGFHRGHREIARQTLRLRRPGWRSGVLSFSNHPATHLRPAKAPEMLNTPGERLALLGAAGFEECFFVRFDDAIARLRPEEFLQILSERLGVHAVVVGSTFRFGHERAGDVAMMHDYFAARGLQTVSVAHVSQDGERISSTRIRTLVRQGELAAADELLGGTGYEIRGPVEVGAGRGHSLGFPTANLRPPEKLLPKDGVYSAVARYDGRDYPALISIGNNPQFKGAQRSVEAWLRDFAQTIYGREVAVRTLRYVREQRLFASAGELMQQMLRDREAIGYPTYG
ncbi:MAG: riboflavin biosynthesis protein RibF [Candidatus Eremiobacteraeota bacterium]|nr:riboflavin biosynthesis protein RibF [Candidatus Eremiobacteraeota bacterium]